MKSTGRPGHFVAETLDEPPSLCMQDEYYGEINQSSVREESDLAHYKPRCDVIFRGDAYAPGGAPATEWNVRLRVSAPTATCDAMLQHRDVTSMLKLKPALDARNPERWMVPASQPRGTHADSSRSVLLDKQLAISGPREFTRRGNRWRLSASETATQVPMRWEYAFGGSSVVRNPRYGAESNEPEFLLNEVCFSNPLGGGWIEARHEGALKEAGAASLERTRAPQIGSIQVPVIAQHPNEFDVRNPDEFIRIVKAYGAHPAGLGVVGRPWVPRLQLAGRYDDDWKANRWPGHPEDFDFGYWNGAPRDQQLDMLPPDSTIELWHLADPAMTANGYMSVQLPDDWPLMHVHLHNGPSFPIPMFTDTLIVDTKTMTLTLTHRMQFIPKGDIAAMESWLHRQPSRDVLRG